MSNDGGAQSPPLYSAKSFIFLASACSSGSEMIGANFDIETKRTKKENEMTGDDSRQKKREALDVAAYLCYNPGVAMNWV